MKKYIIITPTINYMGGAQMYVRNKVVYCREEGWETTVIAGQAGNVVIPELKEFKDTFYELNFPTYFYSKSVRDRIIKKLISSAKIKENDEVIVESTGISNSTWAELLSSKIGAKHLFFLLQEKNKVVNKGLQKYMKFKLERREIAGITKNTLFDMFYPFFCIEESSSYRLSAKCTNVVEDVDSPLANEVDEKKYDYIVGLISRLDKPFVQSAVADFCSFTTKHPNKSFLFLIIGDAPSNTGVTQDLKNQIKQYDNIDLIVTGYLFPIPLCLIRKCGACLASAGSSRVGERSGVPTISYDGNDLKPIGIMGKTTNSSLFREAGQPIPKLDNLLNDILITKQYQKEEPSFTLLKPDYQTHFDFINESEIKKEYFDVNTIKRETRDEKVVSVVLALIGAERYGRWREYQFSKWIKRTTIG